MLGALRFTSLGAKNEHNLGPKMGPVLGGQKWVHFRGQKWVKFWGQIWVQFWGPKLAPILGALFKVQEGAKIVGHFKIFWQKWKPFLVPKISPNSGPQNWSNFGPLVPFWPQWFEFWGRLDPPQCSSGFQRWISFRVQVWRCLATLRHY